MVANLLYKEHIGFSDDDVEYNNAIRHDIRKHYAHLVRGMVVVADLFIAEECGGTLAVALVNTRALVLHCVLLVYLRILLILSWVILELGLDVRAIESWWISLLNVGNSNLCKREEGKGQTEQAQDAKSNDDFVPKLDTRCDVTVFPNDVRRLWSRFDPYDCITEFVGLSVF